MGQDTIETSSRFSSDPSAKTKKKHRPWWRAVIDVTLVVLLLATGAIAANILTLNIKYGNPFFVDGLSMYPCLNAHGMHKEADGSMKEFRFSLSSHNQGDLVDYGWARISREAVNELGRYDIAVTYYPSDGTIDANGNFVPSGAFTPAAKIKRIIGLPGERVRVEDDGTAWGKTTIEKQDGTSLVLRNLYDFQDYPDDGTLSYRDCPLDVGVYPSETGFLGEDEYFVMGDNRRSYHGAHFSNDSRSIGPLRKGYLQGKAFRITAQRSMRNDKGIWTVDFSLWHIRMPWAYAHLDEHIDPVASVSTWTSSSEGI